MSLAGAATRHHAAAADRAGALPGGRATHPAGAGDPVQAAAQAARALRDTRGPGWKRLGAAPVGAARLRRWRSPRAGPAGLARRRTAPKCYAIPSPARRSPPPRANPTADQTAALAAIVGAAAGRGALLFGVTGSGKTLVYLEAVRRALAAGRGAIVLVPEIGLTPQTVSRFRGAFGDEIAVLHSGLPTASAPTPGGCCAGASGGWRSVPAPRSSPRWPKLGLIVIDEEHEASYKNGETPRYHARDVAAGAGPARRRPSGARQRHAVAGDLARTREPGFRLLRLPQRIGARPLPPVEIIDLRIAPKSPAPDRSPGLRRWTRRSSPRSPAGSRRCCCSTAGDYAAFLQCPDCGEVWQCPRCSISLTVHRSPPGLRCHYCGHEEPLPVHLPGVRQSGPADAGRRNPAAGADAGRAVSRGADRADGSGHHEHQVVAPADSRRRWSGARSTC